MTEMGQFLKWNASLVRGVANKVLERAKHIRENLEPFLKAAAAPPPKPKRKSTKKSKTKTRKTPKKKQPSKPKHHA